MASSGHLSSQFNPIEVETAHIEDSLYTTGALWNGNDAGIVPFSVNHGNKTVSFTGQIKVVPKYQRKGIASAMVRDIEKTFPGYIINPGEFTSEGLSFWHNRK